MQQETKTLDEVIVPTETDEQKITRIAGKLVNDRVNKEVISSLGLPPGSLFNNFCHPELVSGSRSLLLFLFSKALALCSCSLIVLNT